MKAFDAKFFRRDPTKAAEEILGARVTRYGETGVNQGLLMELDVVDRPYGIYVSAPGTIVRYVSSDGFRLAIACHEPGKSGIISLLGMKVGDEFLDPVQVYSALGGDLVNDKIVGEGSRLHLTESGLDFAAEGLVVVRELPPNSSPNRVAYLKLTRQ